MNSGHPGAALKKKFTENYQKFTKGVEFFSKTLIF